MSPLTMPKNAVTMVTPVTAYSHNGLRRNHFPNALVTAVTSPCPYPDRFEHVRHVNT